MTLTDDLDKAAVFWYHRTQSVLRECCFVVVLQRSSFISRHLSPENRDVYHNRVHVVFRPKVAKQPWIYLLEVVSLTQNDIVPLYFDVFVAFCVIVHMIVAKGCWGSRRLVKSLLTSDDSLP